jgi:hypothetical protein
MKSVIFVGADYLFFCGTASQFGLQGVWIKIIVIVFRQRYMGGSMKSHKLAHRLLASNMQQENIPYNPLKPSDCFPKDH